MGRKNLCTALCNVRACAYCEHGAVSGARRYGAGRTRNAAWILQAAETFAAAQKSGKQKRLPALSGNAVLAAALGLTGEVAEYDAFRSGKAAIAIATCVQQGISRRFNPQAKDLHSRLPYFPGAPALSR